MEPRQGPNIYVISFRIVMVVAATSMFGLAFACVQTKFVVPVLYSINLPRP
jgi:hypothetical protein